MQQPTQNRHHLAIGLACLIIFPIACASNIKYMTTDTLLSKMDAPKVVIIDARSQSDWSHSHKKIKGAIREDATQVKLWSKKFAKTTPIVIYCA